MDLLLTFEIQMSVIFHKFTGFWDTLHDLRERDRRTVKADCQLFCAFVADARALHITLIRFKAVFGPP